MKHCRANLDACENVRISFNVPVLPYIKVVEGDDALVPCNFTFNGSRGLQTPIPFWRMQRQSHDGTNGQPHSEFLYESAFPSNIRYNRSSRVLLLTNVGRDMNGTSFACSFGSIKGICENNATLITVVTGDFIAITTGASTEISRTPSTSTVTQSEGLSVLTNKGLHFQLSMPMIFAQIVTYLISV